nr:hypothetical protein [uncultured Oscillibacter sp.]
MSKIVDFLYRTPDRPRMGGFEKALYFLLGGMGAAFLFTAFYAENQRLHQIGATAGILGMILVGAFARVRRDGWRQYLLLGLRRDLAVGVVWAVLLYVWIMDPAA